LDLPGVANQPDYQYDLFVSCARIDCAWVDGYLLAALGLSADRIITKQGFCPGASLTKEFERAVKRSRYTVLVLGPAYLSDEWSMFGEQLAAHASVAEPSNRIIPLLKEKCELPLRIDFRVHLDFTDEDSWEVGVARLRDLLAQPEPTLERIPCPYPGMVPFRAADARFFYGREAEIKQMLQHLRHQRFLLVIGPSGSGKSSLVFAGLLPQLTQSSHFPKDFWLVREMRPGPHPEQTLCEVIGRDLAQSPQTLTKLMAAHPQAKRLLLVIDQFEELFTQAESAEQRHFIGVLNTLRRAESCAVLITMSAAFYPDLMNSDLWPVDPSQRQEIAPLRGEFLREAIQQPAQVAGVYLEPRLVERLMVDAADEPGVLPLLQETMVLLWSEMRRRLLHFGAYEQLGGKGRRSGLTVAMATKADATLAELSPAQKLIARRIFLRLVQFGEGRTDTRRQQRVSELHSASDVPSLFDETLNHLTVNRLLTVSGEEKGADKRVDLAHEMLISGWPVFRKWLAERREAEQTRRRLEAKVVEWKRLDRRGGWLDPAELPEAERWLSAPDASELGIDETLRALVRGSRERLAQEEQRWKELYDQAERHRKEAELQRDVAERQREIALGRQLAAQAELVRNERPALLPRGVLLAVEALRRLSSLEADQALRRGLALLPKRVFQVNHGKTVGSVAFSPDGRYIASSSWDHTASIYEVATGLEAMRVRHADVVDTVAFSPDGLYIATGSFDGTVKVTVITSQEEMARLLHEAAVRDVAFSPDGKYVATASDFDEGMARLWDVATGTLIWHVAYGNVAQAVLFSPAGKYLVSTNWVKPVVVFEIDTGKTVQLSQENGILGLAFSPDGRYLATGGGDKKIKVWETTSWDEVTTLKQTAAEMKFDLAFSPDGQFLAAANGRTAVLWDTSNWLEATRMLHDGSVRGLDFSRDSRFLATANTDNTARVWEVATSQEIARMTHQDQVTDVAFSPDGHYLVTGSRDRTACVWEATCHRDAMCLTHESYVQSVTFSTDGKFLAAAGGSIGPTDNTPRYNTARMWEVANWKEVEWMVHAGNARAVTFSRDNRYVAVASEDGSAWVLEIATGNEVASFEYERGLSSIAFDPTGQYLAIAGRDATAHVRRVSNWQEVATLPHPEEVTSVCFSQDGQLLSTASHDGIARIWEIATRRSIAQFQHPTHLTRSDRGPDNVYNRLQSVVLSPDGKHLITASVDGTARMWDVGGRGELLRLSHEDPVNAVVFDFTGEFIATASSDNTARVWEVSTGLEVVRIRHQSFVYDVAFSPDGRYLATASWDKTVRISLLRPDDLIKEACDRLTRNLTREEWFQYLGSEPYCKTCQNLD